MKKVVTINAYTTSCPLHQLPITTTSTLLEFDKTLNIYFRLTISTAEKIHDDMQLVDDNGDAQDLPPATVQTMIGAGWAAFVSAWIINIAFYKVSNFSENRSCLNYFSMFLGSSISR